MYEILNFVLFEKLSYLYHHIQHQIIYIIVHVIWSTSEFDAIMFHEIHFQIVLHGYTCRVQYRDKSVMRSLRVSHSHEISEFDLLTNDLGACFPRVQYICIYVAIRITADQ